MKGILEKKISGWVVNYTELHPNMMVTQYNKSLPLCPYDTPTSPFYVIGNYGEVEFEIEEFWETGLEGSFKVATLINNKNDKKN